MYYYLHSWFGCLVCMCYTCLYIVTDPKWTCAQCRSSSCGKQEQGQGETFVHLHRHIHTEAGQVDGYAKTE